MKQFVISTRLIGRDTNSINNYLKDISSIKPFTPEEEMICAEKASTGDRDAINELVSRNLRFVVSVAKQYVTSQTPLEDLINEGNVGLIKAAEKFKPEMGFKFISYAIWWIRKVIIEHISSNGRLIRLPANKSNNLNKLERKIAELEQILGRKVTIQEALEEFGDVLHLGDKSKAGKDRISEDYETLSVLSGYTMDSLDREINGEDGHNTSLADMMADDSFKPTDHEVYSDDLKNELNRVLDTLKPRERYVMVSLFGLDGEYPKPLKDIGDELGVTREMIRQIKEKCLRIMAKRINKEAIY